VRDDIHRRLPLPRRWKSLVRVATRDAKHPEWERHALNAAASELQGLSPALVVAASRSAEQPSLFGVVDPRLRELAVNPIDHEFLRELAVAPQRSRREAMEHAAGRALGTRIAAQLRSVRNHTARESPRDAEPLNTRLATVFGACDTRQLVARMLDGDRPVAASPPARRPLDFDGDVRSGVQ
jgi:hypothetical protein